MKSWVESAQPTAFHSKFRTEQNFAIWVGLGWGYHAGAKHTPVMTTTRGRPQIQLVRNVSREKYGPIWEHSIKCSFSCAGYRSGDRKHGSSLIVWRFLPSVELPPLRFSTTLTLSLKAVGILFFERSPSFAIEREAAAEAAAAPVSPGAGAGFPFLSRRRRGASPSALAGDPWSSRTRTCIGGTGTRSPGSQCRGQQKGSSRNRGTYGKVCGARHRPACLCNSIRLPQMDGERELDARARTQNTHNNPNDQEMSRRHQRPRQRSSISGNTRALSVRPRPSCQTGQRIDPKLVST